MSHTSIALLGVGTMGAPMGRNLLKAGFRLTVYNRTAAKAESLAAHGARVVSTPMEAAKGAQIIFSMLSDDEASREVWAGPNGALITAEQGAVLVESSTVSPAWINELEGLAKARGLELLDAPVTGSRVQADEGQLLFLVGGSSEVLSKVEHVLQAMSKEVVHLGPVGSGAKMKLLNNFLCGVQIASLAEGLSWLEHSGLNVEKALGILKSGAPGSPLLAGVSSRMMSRDYAVNFVLRLMAKDLRYAHASAADCGVDLTSAANAQELFESAIIKGYGELDMASVVEPLRSTTHQQR